MKDETLELITPFIREATPVGSRVTCDPAPTDTDDDTLVLVGPPLNESLHQYENPIYNLTEVLRSNDWQLGGSNPDERMDDVRDSKSAFNSWTKGEENLIVTADAEFYRLFLLATKVSKQLNLLEKADRIALFQAVLYGNSAVQLTHFEIHMFPVGPPAATPGDFDDLI